MKKVLTRNYAHSIISMGPKWARRGGALRGLRKGEKEMKKDTWKSLKLTVLRYSYAKEAERWANEEDDRRLFHNTYNQIVRGVNSLPDEPDLYVRVAMDALIKKDCEMLGRIKTRFAGS